MKKTLNFFDRLMIAITFAEAGVDASDCTPAPKPAAAPRPNKAMGRDHLAHTAKARG